jgi:putative ABC transport system permease protein
VSVRSANPAALAKALRAEFARLDGHAFVDIKPMPEAVGAALLPAQVGAAFTSGFGAVGALLMMLGIYGLVSFTVSQRTREIGIRKAIGARARDIVGLVVRDSVIPVALGLTAGLLVGALGALGLGGFIFGVSPIDPITIGATATLVLGTAVAASALPALRASRVDPLMTLKVE